MASYFVGNQAQLDKAIRTANGGDSITLAASFKNASVVVYGFNKAGGLTIASEAGGQASVATLKIGNSSGISIKNLDCPQTAGNSPAILVSKSSGIDLSGLHIHGAMDNTGGNGINIQNCTAVTVRNSVFDHLLSGISYAKNNGLVLENNTVSYIRNDGFIGTETSNLKIAHNYFSEWRHTGDIHPDCIQLFTRAGAQPSSNISISDNVFNRGSGTAPQGIFIANVSGKPSFANVSITDNTIVGAMYNGISLNAVQSAIVTGNVVQGYADMPSRISVAGSLGSVVVRNNAASDYAYDGAHAIFTDNRVAGILPLSSIGTITSAIAGLATGESPEAATGSIQSYLASTAPRMVASNAQGLVDHASLAVAGSVSEILQHLDMAHAHGARLTGANVATLSQDLAMIAATNLSLDDHATLTVQLSVSDLRTTAGHKAVSHVATTGVELIGDNTITAGEAAMLKALNHLSLGEGAHVTMVDWGSNLVRSLDSVEALASSGLPMGITLLDKAPVLALTDTQYAADADALALITKPVQITVNVAAGHSATARDNHATLNGSAGNAVLTASELGNTLVGGAGDTLIGGLGHDIFVLRGHFGRETVAGFDATDVLQFDRAMAADFRHFVPSMHQVGSDVVIDLGAGDVLTLAGVDIASLNAGSFHFS